MYTQTELKQKESFTLGVIEVPVGLSGPEEATSGLAKLLSVEKNYFRIDGNRKYCRLNSQVNNPKASGRQKSTHGDLRRRICSVPVEPEVVGLFRLSTDVP